MPDDQGLEDGVRHSRGDLNHAVNGRRERREMILTHPAGGKREQRQPKQQVKICPHDPAIDAACRLEHVVVIVPIDPQIDKAQHVRQKYRP